MHVAEDATTFVARRTSSSTTIGHMLWARTRSRDGASRLAAGIAKGVGLVSRGWRQRGLGTIYHSLGRTLRLQDTVSVVELGPGDWFETPVFDACWGPTALAGRPYEPELLHLFRRLRDLPVSFLDAGANFGYWSVMATGHDIRWSRAVAIEANPATFTRLQRNSELNGGRFDCVCRAISDVADREVLLVGTDEHIVAHVDEKATTGVKVLTTTVDQLLSERDWPEADSIVVKLDVEGAELQALRGATRLRETRDHLFLVEDWETDRYPTCRALFELGYPLYYVTQRGACVRLRDTDDIDRVRSSDRKSAHGTNFVAARQGGRLHGELRNWSGA